MAIRHLPYTVIMIIISLIPVAVLFIPDARHPGNDDDACISDGNIHHFLS